MINELRKGNYFQVKSTFFKVDQMFNYHVQGVNSDKELCLVQKPKPIELTPELFKKIRFGYFGFELHYDSDLGDYRYNRVDGGATSIKYLHQLQNLYFSLFGEELKIEL